MAAFGGFGLATANADRTIGATGSPKATTRNEFIEPEDGVYNEKFNSDDKNEHDRTPGSSDDSIEHEKKLNKEVGDLARIYSNHSGVSKHSDYEKNPFDFEERKGSSLDPHSENFSPRAWAKALLKIQSGDPEKWKQRTSGFAYRNLNVHGFGEATDYQKSVSNVVFEVLGYAKKLVGMGKKRKIQILRNFEGLVHSGEMLVVLGPPGSGCSTFLKTIAGETDGIYVDAKSELNYEGISAKEMHTRFRGEAIYQAEVDVHFPQLSVGDTLAFAAQARAPRHIPGGVSREVYAKHIRDVLMAMFGISHTINTKVGNDFVRGVSGGERKRVSIAEAALSYAPLQCWDNSTRGLDSANALEFCKTLRMSTELLGATACVAIYQASQSAYDIFDKVAVLYEGRQIFFGPCDEASHYFEELGFSRPSRQTTADFLTSMTSPDERIVREGFENRVPRTPDDFAAAWQRSDQRKALLKELDEYDQRYPIGGESRKAFVESKRLQQAKGARKKSPYTMSYPQQVALCLKRGFWRLKGDPSLTFTQLFGNFAMALVIGSIFYNLQDVTSSFYSRGALLFFAILLNAFGSFLEILTLYAQRPIVEKHARYALYHPSAEAFASMLTDMPYKILNAIFFNLALYFLTNLRREPGAFFFFLLISFTLTLTMSMMFRTIGSVSRSLPQAMAPAAIIIIGIVVYTGFVIPVPSMVGWSRWINYIDPVAYGFESLMINEFAGQDYACDQFIPSAQLPQYAGIGGTSRICSPVGSVAGNNFVSGTAYIEESFQYYPIHKWRNLGIIFVFMVGFMVTYLIASELVSAKKSKGEVLLFRRGHAPAAVKKVMAQGDGDVEGAGGMATIEKTKTDVSAVIQKQTAIFHWQDVCYDIKIKGEPRRILDHVDGWVKPGTLTALMGVSGAGKTTLLDVLATRVTMGVVTGEMLVDGRLADESFQRKTGYVQQQDLHLQTSTVREALNFSALLRQSASIPRQEKLDYVTEVIKILEMEDYADAVVGVPGEGLNVEQRKRLTIGVELAAKPELLLFLDEPTSGLDSQTSWSICDLMEKLTQSGQAVLCTIHQPSAMLFQRFNRLLFLAKGGKTVYFGEIGENSDILLDYFKRNGGFECPSDANPAEYMLEVIGAAPGSKTEIDWPAVWRQSEEYKKVKEHLEELKETLPEITKPAASADDKTSYREFAAGFGVQFREVIWRVYQQYWRTPSYIYSKLALSILGPIFIGFSFYKADTSLQGLQDQVFSIFMLFILFGSFVQQIMPHFVTQRALYESRERPSKAYSWKAFMLSNIIVELCWNFLAGTIVFFCWYYPIGFYRNAAAAGQLHERGALMYLLVLQFLLFTSSFTNLVIAGIPDAETGGNIANLAFSLTLVFCGVLAGPSVFPHFWIFMYRLSPFTYLVSAMLSVGVANVPVVCSSTEVLSFTAPPGMDCGTYMTPYIEAAGGYLLSNTTSNCQFCTVSETNTFLAGVSSYYSDRWMNYGILWAFIVFNIFGALAIYYLARVPKKNGLFGLKKRKQE